jgi:hypothetical protein
MMPSPDGKTLLTASEDGTARLWDFESGAPVSMLMAQEEFLFAATFSRDGRWIAAAGGGRKDGDKYQGGAQHDIHIFEMPAPTAEPAVVSDSPAPWFWIASLAALVIVLASAALFVVRHRRQPYPASPRTVAKLETASPLVFPCSHCGTRLKVKPQFKGKSVKCPKCAIPTAVP